jgi:epoxyqueuosine reductase QueG
MTYQEVHSGVVHRYQCVNDRCPEYHKVKKGLLSPKEYRDATGSPVRCSICGDVLVLVTDADIPSVP